ncbi:uncharacterized protein LOC126779667 [Nymphalis io]|uniref:uncharacterized protein LOC126779667 n=1 Tax=Inachis io TaxID=171585 RepID=UPI00216710BD|nr:uncharacterized protein LOC126779667 [Nymphalis io]
MLYFNMSPSVRLLVTFALLHQVVFIASAKANTKSKNGPNCQSFSQGVTFKDTEAIGVWHLLHFRTEKTKGSGDPHCVEFTPVDEKEINELKDQIGKFVENLNWENITLKMQIPCKSINKTRDYYLERLGGDGSYRTLQKPPSSAKLDLAEFNRYPMRLKIIEGIYLGMMDCHEKFVFILGKQPPEGKELDDRLKKMIEAYWPEE